MTNQTSTTTTTSTSTTSSSNSSNRAQHTLRAMNLTHNERWSEENIQQAIRTWNLSAVEQEQLRLLKTRLADEDVNHFKNTPHELVRYMKGPKGFDQAEAMFRTCIAWRKNSPENIDNLLDTYKPPRALYEYAPSGLLQGSDHEGDPVYLERAGDMDGFGFVQRYSPDVLLKDVVWRRELTAHGAWIEDYVAEHGHLPRQLTVVYDLKGLSSRHCKKGVGAFFKDAVAYTHDKYYGVSKRMIIIRAPTIFKMVWRIAKHFFAPEVREKMVFATGDHLETLDKYMDRNILPEVINPQGKGQTARGFPPCLDGGIIPDDFTDTGSSGSNVGDACSGEECDEVCSTSGNTVYTYRSRDSGSFSSDDGGQSQHASHQCRTSVSVKPIARGFLKLSSCGTQIHLDPSTLEAF